MEVFLRAACFLLITASPAVAQDFDYKDILIEINVKDGHIVQGERGVIEFKFTLPPGYSLTSTDEFPRIKLMNDVPGLRLGKLKRPEPHYTDAVGGHYEFYVALEMPFYFTSETGPGEHEVEFGFVLQACQKGGMCYMPTKTEDVKKKTKIKLVREQT